jgi:hypothetical protein
LEHCLAIFFSGRARPFACICTPLYPKLRRTKFPVAPDQNSSFSIRLWCRSEETALIANKIILAQIRAVYLIVLAISWTASPRMIGRLVFSRITHMALDSVVCLGCTAHVPFGVGFGGMITRIGRSEPVEPQARPTGPVAGLFRTSVASTCRAEVSWPQRHSLAPSLRLSGTT